MGQAFRRATGRIKSSSLETTASKNAVDRRPPVVPADKVEIPKTDEDGHDNASRVNAENVLEERDPSYDAMLSQMVGRIKAKPGGKLEMGEAFVVERYNRSMPKLRDTKPDSGKYEEQPTPPGTLNVAQLRHIILLHQGKADDHEGPMEIHQIAKKFRVDAEQIRKILQFASLPPEDTASQPKKFR